jgi:hypothetical protein
VRGMFREAQLRTIQIRPLDVAVMTTADDDTPARPGIAAAA